MRGVQRVADRRDPERWTIRRMVEWMALDFVRCGIESARLDADLLLAHALGVERIHLYLDRDRPLTPDELASVRGLVTRRRKREPIAYILGFREFYGRRFQVNPSVLVPRPETEGVVDEALDGVPSDMPVRGLDLCTGSGAIAVTLAAERPSLVMTGTDVSERALGVARTNADAHQVGSRIDFRCGDLFDAVPADGRYRLITANPPYCAENEWDSLPPDVSAHEPREALVAGVDGLQTLHRIVEGAGAFLEPKGRLLLEVGAGQAAAVVARLANRDDFCETRTVRDLSGTERVVVATRR